MRLTALSALLALAASSQAQTSSPTFDVASVKVSATPAGRGGPGGPGGGPGRDGGGGGRGGRGAPIGGPGTNDPSRIRFNFATIKALLVYAYGVQAYQVSGPAFLDSERFDIEGRMPADTTRDQVNLMLQNLLADRFGVKLHRATKELPMYSMVVSKGGTKLKTSAPVDPAKQAQADQPPQGPPPMPGRGDMKFDSDGFPIFPGGGPFGPGRGGRGGLGMMMAPGNRARIMGTQATSTDLASQLTNLLSRPVTDQTGLSAKYDITLTFSTEGLNLTQGDGRGGPPGGGFGGPGGPEGMQPQGDPPPDLFNAIQAQLGLRLDAKKGPVDLLVVDHAEKTPVEN